ILTRNFERQSHQKRHTGMQAFARKKKSKPPLRLDGTTPPGPTIWAAEQKLPSRDSLEPFPAGTRIRLQCAPDGPLNHGSRGADENRSEGQRHATSRTAQAFTDRVPRCW